MTTTLSAKGQIVIPGVLRERLRLKAGDDFLVLTSSRGDITLRPIGQRSRSLREGLARLGDVPLRRLSLPVPMPPAL